MYFCLLICLIVCCVCWTLYIKYYDWIMISISRKELILFCQGARKQTSCSVVSYLVSSSTKTFKDTIKRLSDTEKSDILRVTPQILILTWSMCSLFKSNVYKLLSFFREAFFKPSTRRRSSHE